MTAKSVLLRLQGLRPRARAPTYPLLLLRHCMKPLEAKYLFILFFFFSDIKQITTCGNGQSK